MKQTLEKVSLITRNKYFRGFSVTAILALLVFLFFYKILIFPESFHIPFDLHGFHYPQAYEIFSAFKDGYFPLWDPYAYSGMPLAGNVTAQLFYPPNLFVLKLSDWIYGTLPFRMIEYQLIAHYLLAGLGIYLLARSFFISVKGSILAAVIYQFGGFFASQTQHLGLIDGAAWVPLMLFFLKRAYDTHRFIFVALAGLTLALLILAGFPALAVVTLTILTICCLSIFITEIKSIGVKDAARILIFLFLTVTFAFGFAAIMLLPAMELSNLSISQLRSLYGSIEGLPVEGHLSLIIPSLFGVGSANYFGGTDFTMAYLYVGIIPLILSVLAIQFRRDKTTLLIASLAVFSLIWSLGTLVPISAWLWVFMPGFLKGAIYPFCAKLFFDLGIALLAAFGLDCLTNILQKEGIRKIKTLTKYLMLFITGLVLLDMFLYAQVSILTQAADKQRFFDFIKGINTLILLLLLFVGAAYLRSSRRIKPSVIGTVLLLITIIDLFSFGSGKIFNTFDTASEEFLTSETLEKNAFPINFLKSDPDYLHGRYMRVETSEIGGLWLTASRLWRLENSNGDDPLLPQNYLEYRSSFSDTSGRQFILRNPKSRLLDLLSVKYVLLPQHQIETNKSQKFEVVGGDGMHILKNLDFMPRAYLAYRPVHARNLKHALRKLQSSSFNPRLDVVLEGENFERNRFMHNGKPPDGFVKIISKNANKMELESASDIPAFLVISELFYPGWNAYVDGNRQKVLKANGIFRAVEVPSGKHRVSFKYESTTLRVGLTLTIITVVIFCVMLFRAYKQPRKLFTWQQIDQRVTQV